MIVRDISAFSPVSAAKTAHLATPIETVIFERRHDTGTKL
jgi:hypothetical protein